jgi:hypothetical protein
MNFIFEKVQQMAGKQSSSNRARNLATLGLATALCLSAGMLVAKGQGSAAQLLKEGSSYQGADDTSDRAAIVYRIVIQKYPRSIQAEQAQFYLGTYYQNKFFIIEHKYGKQDWSAFNQAEDALKAYAASYPKGTYLADAYHSLALISLRRGYSDSHQADAKAWLVKMSGQGTDSKIYMYKVIWSPHSDDVVKRTCNKNALAAAETILINRNTTFDNFTTALKEWCKNNCN